MVSKKGMPSSSWGRIRDSSVHPRINPSIEFLSIIVPTISKTPCGSERNDTPSDHLGLHGHCIVVGQDGLDIADGREKVPAQADGRAQHSGEDHYKRHACARPGA